MLISYVYCGMPCAIKPDMSEEKKAPPAQPLRLDLDIWEGVRRLASSGLEDLRKFDPLKPEHVAGLVAEVVALREEALAQRAWVESRCTCDESLKPKGVHSSACPALERRPK